MAKVLKIPVPNILILASGGITLDNLKDYIEYDCDCCVFGWLLTSGSSANIMENTKKICKIITEFH